MKRRRLLASLMIALWLIAAGGYLYGLEAARWQPFMRADLAQFDGSALRNLANTPTLPGHITIVHFYDAQCACSQATLQHIADFKQRYGKRISQYFFSNADAKAGQTLAGQVPPAPAAMAALWGQAVPSSPAVAVWDERGTLAYFGPYSSGPICGTGKDFVSVALDALMHGENLGFINTTAVGCFCPWHRDKTLGA